MINSYNEEMRKIKIDGFYRTLGAIAGMFGDTTDTTKENKTNNDTKNDKTDEFDEQNQYVLTYDLPGLSPERVKVSMKNVHNLQYFFVSVDDKIKEQNYVYNSVRTPRNGVKYTIIKENIYYTMKHGQLKIFIPYQKEVKPQSEDMVQVRYREEKE